MASVFTYRGNVCIKYKGLDGKFKVKSLGKDPSKQEIHQIKTEIEKLELNLRLNAPVQTVTLGLFDAFKQFNNVLSLEPKTKNSLDREFTTFQQFVDYAEYNEWKTFQHVDVEKYLIYRRNEQGLSPTTLEKDKRVISKFYKYCIKSHLATTNPCLEIKTPRVTLKSPRYYSEDELKRILETSKEPYKSLFEFLSLTGLRSGEAANLRYEDCNLDQRFIIIRVIDGDRKTRKCGNKTKIEGTVPLNERAYQILLDRFNKRENPDFVFNNAEGNQLDNDNAYRTLIRICKNLNIKDTNVHTFRHTFASYLAIKGVSLFVISKLLRHKSIEQTMIYSHLSDEATRKAVDLL